LYCSQPNNNLYHAQKLNVDTLIRENGAAQFEINFLHGDALSLAPDIDAPVTLSWGYDNRTMAFRVPRSDREGTRVENRFPGADTNPYLAFAATLVSGLVGMKKQLKASDPHTGTANEDEIEVARTLEEGLRHLLDTPEVSEILGDLFLRAYTSVKLDEFEEFNRVISSWERNHLLLQV
jgi:glutamine synthetase